MLRAIEKAQSHEQHVIWTVVATCKPPCKPNIFPLYNYTIIIYLLSYVLTLSEFSGLWEHLERDCSKAAKQRPDWTCCKRPSAVQVQGKQMNKKVCFLMLGAFNSHSPYGRLSVQMVRTPWRSNETRWKVDCELVHSTLILLPTNIQPKLEKTHSSWN